MFNLGVHAFVWNFSYVDTGIQVHIQVPLINQN